MRAYCNVFCFFSDNEDFLAVLEFNSKCMKNYLIKTNCIVFRCFSFSHLSIGIAVH